MGSNSDTSSFARVVRAVVLALALVLVIFAAYEIIERTWLHALEDSTRHFFHQFRGLLASLVAAVFVGWFVTRAASPFRADTLSTDQWIEGSRPDRTQRMLSYMRWFVWMRWIAIGVILGLVVITVQVAEILPARVWWPMIAAVAVLIALNVIYTLMIRHGYGLRYGLPVQAYADLVILVLLLHFSGGIENPLAPLMLFHVIIAGIVLDRGQCYWVAGVGSMLFALMALGEWAELIPHYKLSVFPHPIAGEQVLHAAHETQYVLTRIGLHVVILLLTAYFVTSLADRIREDEQKLRALADQTLSQRQLLEQAMEVTDTGLCVCDEHFEPYLMNEQWRKWFGDTSARTLLHAERSSSITRHNEDGQTWSTEIAITQPEDGAASQNSTGGARRSFRVTTAQLLDGSGQFKHHASLAQEITAQKRTQEQMVRAGKLAAIGELAGQMAHEINNPIGIVSAKVRLLLSRRRQELSGKVADDLECVAEQVDRVARITGGLLSYCRPAGTGRARTDLRGLIRDSLQLIEPQAQDATVQIDDRLPRHPLPVHANTDELQQVFLNLFLNSLDAMPEGGCLTVTAATQHPISASEWIEIAVTDTGTGMAPDIVDRLFEPFFTTKPEGKGTGLGLSICHGLVRSHGGRMEVNSEPGAGTKVTVVLPGES